VEGYIGETVLESLDGTPYESFTPNDWAMVYIGRYGQIDGSHHKQWVLDQVARILHGTPIELRLARWENGYEEYRFNTLEPSQEYLDWVKEMRGDYDEECEEYEYSYDKGVPL